MQTTSLPRPIMRFAVHETGALERLGPWFICVAFPPDLLSRADGQRIEVRGDEVTIRCSNGSATYALSPPGPDRIRPGRLLRSTT